MRQHAAMAGRYTPFEQQVNPRRVRSDGPFSLLLDSGRSGGSNRASRFDFMRRFSLAVSSQNCPTRAQAARFPYDQVPVPPRLSTTNVAKSASWRSSVLSLAKTRSDSRRTHKCPGRWRRSWTSDGRRTMHRSGAQTERLVSRKTLARAQITFQSRRLRDGRC